MVEASSAWACVVAPKPSSSAKRAMMADFNRLGIMQALPDHASLVNAYIKRYIECYISLITKSCRRVACNMGLEGIVSMRLEHSSAAGSEISSYLLRAEYLAPDR